MLASGRHQAARARWRLRPAALAGMVPAITPAAEVEVVMAGDFQILHRIPHLSPGKPGYKVFFQAAVAGDFATAFTHAAAISAGGFFAGAAVFQAIAATAVITIAAIARALVAVVVVAPIAAAAVVVTGDIAAVVAGNAVPTGQRHVGGVGVVVLKYGTDEDEEITQAPGGQRQTDARSGLAFTQFLVADMGMGNAFIRFGRMGIDGDDLVA